ncbi:PREDICTED: normal mucosa of esophagus-specific gene 1 protein-like isoform X2 [Branchiostoma belcheri]|uniref:Normal mucosa of esophagus-specific gene 1 protein-like isoform X2 n=1 Tax=Branchiostoma belcheri TaxID=7741 RepID=A0A6P4Y202_BRABE|nr:PREDICTED: normal mucosa of esophagus-specific gene 1 protein-like isoform X2 [Branchiostoma belcheri]
MRLTPRYFTRTPFYKFFLGSLKTGKEVWPLVTIVTGVGCMAVSALTYTAIAKSDVVFDKKTQPWLKVPLDRPTQKLVTINQTYKDIPQLKVMSEIREMEKQ